MVTNHHLAVKLADTFVQQEYEVTCDALSSTVD